MKELVSVVIPIYNVEKHLERCLNSVVNQTYLNLEIILVDDGSSDHCPQMCDEWALRDERIRVIHKKNAGLGMARNTGIENATGQYICFFDSDDYIALDTIDKAITLAEKEQADIVTFGMCSVDRNGNVVNRLVPESEKICYRNEEIYYEFLPSVLQPSMYFPKTKNLRLSAWSCLFSTELIKHSNWRFVSEREIISEDVYSLLVLYKYVDVVAVLREALYYYCENNSSLTHTYREDRFIRNKQFYRKCIELCVAFDYPEAVRKSCISPFLGNVIETLKQIVSNCDISKDAIKLIHTIINDPIVQETLIVKKGDPVSRNTRILFWAMRNKYYYLCYLFLFANNILKK